MKPLVKPAAHLRVEWLPAIAWNECPSSVECAGETPDRAMPGLFRSLDARTRVLQDATSIVARLNRPEPEQK